MEYLYLLMKRPRLADMAAASALLREVYHAECRGLAPCRLGLIYALPTKVLEDDAEVLDVVEWH